MKKSRFSEEKIISILKALEAGAKAAELARKYGVSEVTIRATLDMARVYSRVLPNCAPLVARWSDMSQQTAPASQGTSRVITARTSTAPARSMALRFRFLRKRWV